MSATTGEPTASARLVSYHFSVGNSDSGPVGYCARVIATSRAAALATMHETIDSLNGEHNVSGKSGPLQYFEVYFNADAVTEADIDEEDDVYCDVEPCNEIAVSTNDDGDCFCAAHC